MNDLENYAAILDEYFGGGTATFATDGDGTNEIIGALNRPNFGPFRASFENRLERLAALYQTPDSNRQNLIVRANDVSTANNWDGAYAEMVAFDFLNSNRDYLPGLLNLSKTVPATETFGGELGMQNGNFDGYYDEFNLCLDVKAFGDKSRNLLDSVISRAKKKLGIRKITIIPEYSLDQDYEAFERNWKILLTELEAAIDVKAQPKYFRSKAMPELSYRLLWGPGVATTISTYDPYIHAEKHHKLFFTKAYVKKFSKAMPSLIVSIVFPWISESVTNRSAATEILYRALCRRFFCQYAKDTTPATAFVKGFQGNQTIAQVTERLSGVIFLEDASITSSTPELQNVKGFAYLNPNAAQKVSGHFRDYLSSLHIAVDDFAHDNY